MNEFKKQHIEKKKSVIDTLSSAEIFLREHNYTHEADMIVQQRKNLENGEFSISLVGEFSAGKSTFLNALMGNRILPSFTNETTATINFLRHKDKSESGESGCVYYNDGRKQTFADASLETISKYVSTASKEVDVANSISHLDLFLESKFLEGNVTLVDTPGLNGIAQGHKELTMEQIEKSSAGIFLFDANKPGSESDFDFLTQLRKRVKSIIFVLNKIDNIKESEGETVDRVIAKLKENYKTVYPDETTIPEIWPVAAYPALIARDSSGAKMDYNGKNVFTAEEKAGFEKNSGMHEFEDRLWKFLTHGEKAKQELLTPVTQLISHLKDVEQRSKNELDVLNGTVDKGELEEKMLGLNQQLAELEDRLNEQTKGMRTEIRLAEKEFEEEINAGIEDCKKRYGQKIINFVDIEEIAPQKIEIDVKNQLKTLATSAYRDFSERLETIAEMSCNEVTDDLNAALSSGLNIQLNNKLELTAFNVGIEQYEKEVEETKKELEKLKAIAESSEDSFLEAMSRMEKQEELERKLENKIKARDMYEQTSLNSAPGEYRSEQTKQVRKARGGVLGTIKDFFDGGELQMQTETVVDSRERDRYMRERQSIIDRHNQEIAKLEKDLASKGNVDLKIAEREFQRKNAELEEQRKELAKLQSEFAEKIKRTREIQLKRQKDEVYEFIDDITDAFIKEIRKMFKEERQTRSNIMTDMIARSIKKQIELKKQEVEQLQNTAAEAASERNSRIEQINAEIKKLKEILKKAVDIEIELESIEIDVIKEESL